MTLHPRPSHTGIQSSWGEAQHLGNFTVPHHSGEGFAHSLHLIFPCPDFTNEETEILERLKSHIYRWVDHQPPLLGGLYLC